MIEVRNGIGRDNLFLDDLISVASDDYKKSWSQEHPQTAYQTARNWDTGNGRRVITSRHALANSKRKTASMFNNTVWKSTRVARGHGIGKRMGTSA